MSLEGIIPINHKKVLLEGKRGSLTEPYDSYLPLDEDSAILA